MIISLLVPSLSQAQSAEACITRYHNFAHRVENIGRAAQVVGVAVGVGSVVAGIVHPDGIPGSLIGVISGPIVWLGGVQGNRLARFSELVADAAYEVTNKSPGPALNLLTEYVNEIVFSAKLVTNPKAGLPAQDIGPQDEQQSRLHYTYITPENMFKAIEQLIAEDALCPAGGKHTLNPSDFNAAVVDRISPRD